jgi:hypothetical protein
VKTHQEEEGKKKKKLQLKTKKATGVVQKEKNKALTLLKLSKLPHARFICFACTPKAGPKSYVHLLVMILLYRLFLHRVT